MMTIEEQREKAIAEQIRRMAGDDMPPANITEAVSTASHLSAQKVVSVKEYKTVFLRSHTIEQRTSMGLDKNLLESYRSILYELGERTTLSAYIDNVLREHLRTHKSMLLEAIRENRKTITIID